MLKKGLRSPLKFTAILSLILVCALSATWAATTYYKSVVIPKGNGVNFNVMRDGPNTVRCWFTAGALDNYMTDEGVDQVTLTVEMTEEWITRADGTGYYRLNFIFGPSGAYFDIDPFHMKIKGRKYVSDDTEIWLYDENGEALPGTRSNGRNYINFEIPHFSEYSYDDYY